MATEVTETADKEVTLLPCPFCGSQPEVYKGWQTERVSCRNRSCGLFNVSILTKFWNNRADAPNTRQRAERAASLIWTYMTFNGQGQSGTEVQSQIADIVAAEFEK